MTSGIKNPGNEAQVPAAMPTSQQGQGGVSQDDDPAGQQGSTQKKSRMAPQPSAPPGLEQDAQGQAIPFEQCTPEDQEKARTGRK